MATQDQNKKSLLEEAIRLSGLKTEEEVLALALREFVERRQLSILSLRGKIDFDPTFDYKVQRNRT